MWASKQYDDMARWVDKDMWSAYRLEPVKRGALLRTIEDNDGLTLDITGRSHGEREKRWS
jgi:hypothetical protein